MKLEEACVFARVGVSCMTWLGAFVREVDELANVFRYSLQYIRYPLFLVRNVLFFFLTRTTSPGYVLILKPRLQQDFDHFKIRIGLDMVDPRLDQSESKKKKIYF